MPRNKEGGSFNLPFFFHYRQNCGCTLSSTDAGVMVLAEDYRLKQHAVKIFSVKSVNSFILSFAHCRSLSPSLSRNHVCLSAIRFASWIRCQVCTTPLTMVPTNAAIVVLLACVVVTTCTNSSTSCDTSATTVKMSKLNQNAGFEIEIVQNTRERD